jgi:predicted adenine nucleotide alpha hydrolase (AANH) superfamily ATPase
VKLLLHICCAPCAIYPLRVLREDDLEVMGFFYRHNIHPYTECLRRQEALADYADRVGLRVICQEGYDLEGFLRRAVYRESTRCLQCYHDRLRSTALIARRGKFDYFSSTLLYSRHQQHDVIRAIGESVARETGVAFYYRDFRTGWKEGIDVSKELGMYRQSYCGCIYSEKERYCRSKADGAAVHRLTAGEGHGTR